jgi:methyl-galactoside transport system permease protein
LGGCIRRSGKVQSPRDMPAAGALLCFSEAESGGFLLGNKAGGASTATGFGYELEDIAACTIGGVSTNGGVGKVSGVIIGVLVFEVLKICLQFMGVGPAQTFIVQGFVIIVGVALDLRKYLAKK